ncbi:MAG: AsmA family protein [Beijerinckiaceae bacterium]|nr:MAG: AsmA family protein [Beijerinckiaceae bacterium]
MRESLTVLAGLLILVLSAALVVPYFVNWDAERGLVESQLSEVLARPVKIRGTIDLKLLPTPYLRLADVEIGSPTAGPEIKADAVQLEIALPALLRGEVDFVEAKLVRPQLALTIKDDALPLGPPLRHLTGSMRFERISVEDGSLSLNDPATGRSYAATDISLSAEAGSLSGPFKAEGHFAVNGQATSFHFGSGERNGDRMHFKLILNGNEQHPRADLDAALVFAKSSLPSVSGQITLAGNLSGAIALPWQASGKLTGSLRKAAIDNLDLQLGGADRGMSLNGAARFAFGREPRINATLKAHQIDLDRLLNAKGSPPAMQQLERAITKAMSSDSPIGNGMPLKLGWSVATAILGGDSLSGLSGELSLAGGQSLGLKFDASGPGRSHLHLEGKVETGAAAGFKGDVEAGSRDVARLKTWLMANLPQDKFWLAALPQQPFDVSGLANLSGVGFVVQDLALRLGPSNLSGTVAYTKSVGSDAARFFADVSVPRLDLDSVPDVTSFARWTKPTDLSLRFDAQAAKIGSEGGLETGHIHLKLEKTGRHARLDQFTVTGLGGADIALHGNWDGQSGDMAGTVDSKKLEAAAALLHRLAPGRVTDMILARAAELSPIHAKFTAQGRMGPQNTIVLSGLDMTGTTGGTKIAAKLSSKAPASGEGAPADLSLTAQLDSGDGLALIHQLGFAVLPLHGFGTGHIAITANGNLGKGFTTQATAVLADTRAAFTGNVELGSASPHAAGKVHMTSAALTPLLEATGLAFPDPVMRLPADVKADVDADASGVVLRDLSGTFADDRIAGNLTYDAAKNRVTGSLDTGQLSLATLLATGFGQMSAPKAGALWSSHKFGSAMLDLPPIDLALHAKSLDLLPQISGSDARFGLAISGRRTGFKMTLRNVAMKLGDGTLAADLTLRRNGATAAASGQVKLKDYDLALPSLRGKLSGELDFAGTGDSAAAMISGLAGSGTLTFANLVLPRTDPGGMQRVFKSIEDDDMSLDPDEVDRTLLAELDKGASHLGSMTFEAGLAAGTLRLTPKGMKPKRLDSSIEETLQASLDIDRLSLDQRSHLTLVDLPKDWNGPPPSINLVSAGALNNPTRTIESGIFVNTLAARAIARENARIQAQEFDIHEQAFFYNRHKSERRREQERTKAKEEAERAANLNAAAEKSPSVPAIQPTAKDKTKKEKAAPAGAAAPLRIERPSAKRRAQAVPLHPGNHSPIIRRPLPPPAAQAPALPGPVNDPLSEGRF